MKVKGFDSRKGYLKKFFYFTLQVVGAILVGGSVVFFLEEILCKYKYWSAIPLVLLIVSVVVIGFQEKSARKEERKAEKILYENGKALEK
jgi:hypothetical protein